MAKFRNHSHLSDRNSAQRIIQHLRIGHQWQPSREFVPLVAASAGSGASQEPWPPLAERMALRHPSDRSTVRIVIGAAMTDVRYAAMDEVRTRQLEPSVASAEATAELIAVIVAVTDGEPRVLTIDAGQALPSGPFELTHRSLQSGMRSWVEQQTHHPLGYVEQLYTFADRDRTLTGQRVVSISYLGLTREARASAEHGVSWQSWYRYFPWEDHRGGAPALEEQISARLRNWAEAAADAATRRERQHRIRITFGHDGRAWNEELILQRYELLWEAGLVSESPQAREGTNGAPMRHDHRRILATGIARLRAKIKYRPVVFELMPPHFTLLQLQRAVEALAGRRLHKQNFRRLIEQQDLVEETGAVATETGGRPAKLFRFRRDVLAERAVAGSKLPLAR